MKSTARYFLLTIALMALSYPMALADTLELKEELGLADLKVIVLSNATLLDRPRVKDALALMDGSRGELWLKLDAGTEAFYNLVDRSTIPYEKVLRNILETARVRPIVVQSLFMKVSGVGPSEDEISAYCDRVHEILDGGGAIKLIQVYTVARPPAESYVTPLSDAEVDALAETVRLRVSVPIETYYSGRMT